jgi:hypothetical protein
MCRRGAAHALYRSRCFASRSLGPVRRRSGPHFQHKSSPSQPHSNNISLDSHGDILFKPLRQDAAVRTPQQRTCASCARDSKGRIARSATAKRDFQKAHPCPSTDWTTGACAGYVIDHVTPLKRGGADAPSNMQWQTTAAAKSKDRVE